MRDRNIFAELPVEELADGDNVSNSVIVASKQRKTPKKHNKKRECEYTESSVSAYVKEFDKLTISKMANNKGTKDLNEVKSTIRKKATGADNWQIFLEKVKSINSEHKIKNDDLILDIDGKDVDYQKRVSRCVAIDCEMVGIGEDGKGNMLARVSIVNSLGKCLYDTFVKPTTAVTDYRTPVSGVRPSDLAAGEKFSIVQKKVLEILRGKILVGHAVHNDLIVLKIRHPRHDIRDTSKYKKFYSIGSGTPSLKRLTSHFLNVDIQNGEHNSVQDAQATMQLYMLYRKEWEADIKRKKHSSYQQHSHVKKKSKTSYKPNRFGKNYRK